MNGTGCLKKLYYNRIAVGFYSDQGPLRRPGHATWTTFHHFTCRLLNQLLNVVLMLVAKMHQNAPNHICIVQKFSRNVKLDSSPFGNEYQPELNGDPTWTFSDSRGFQIILSQATIWPTTQLFKKFCSLYCSYLVL